MTFDIFCTPTLYIGRDFKNNRQLDAYLAKFPTECAIPLMSINMQRMYLIETGNEETRRMLEELKELLMFADHHLRRALASLADRQVGTVQRESEALQSLTTVRKEIERIDFDLLHELHRLGGHAALTVDLVQTTYQYTRDGGRALELSLQRADRRRSTLLFYIDRTFRYRHNLFCVHTWIFEVIGYLSRRENAI